MVTPIIPIHHQPPPPLPTILFHHNMSYENVADFQDFMGVGREGSYSSNKENNGRIVAFWLIVPTNAIVHSPSPEGRSPGSGVMTCGLGFPCCSLSPHRQDC